MNNDQLSNPRLQNPSSSQRLFNSNDLSQQSLQSKLPNRTLSKQASMSSTDKKQTRATSLVAKQQPQPQKLPPTAVKSLPISISQLQQKQLNVYLQCFMQISTFQAGQKGKPLIQLIKQSPASQQSQWIMTKTFKLFRSSIPEAVLCAFQFLREVMEVGHYFIEQKLEEMLLMPMVEVIEYRSYIKDMERGNSYFMSQISRYGQDDKANQLVKIASTFFRMVHQALFIWATQYFPNSNWSKMLTKLQKSSNIKFPSFPSEFKFYSQARIDLFKAVREKHKRLYKSQEEEYMRKKQESSLKSKVKGVKEDGDSARDKVERSGQRENKTNDRSQNGENKEKVVKLTENNGKEHFPASNFPKNAEKVSFIAKGAQSVHKRQSSKGQSKQGIKETPPQCSYQSRPKKIKPSSSTSKSKPESLNKLIKNSKQQQLLSHNRKSSRIKQSNKLSQVDDALQFIDQVQTIEVGSEHVDHSKCQSQRRQDDKVNRQGNRLEQDGLGRLKIGDLKIDLGRIGKRHQFSQYYSEKSYGGGEKQGERQYNVQSSQYAKNKQNQSAGRNLQKAKVGQQFELQTFRPKIIEKANLKDNKNQRDQSKQCLHETRKTEQMSEKKKNGVQHHDSDKKSLQQQKNATSEDQSLSRSYEAQPHSTERERFIQHYSGREYSKESEREQLHQQHLRKSSQRKQKQRTRQGSQEQEKMMRKVLREELTLIKDAVREEVIVTVRKELLQRQDEGSGEVNSNRMVSGRFGPVEQDHKTSKGIEQQPQLEPSQQAFWFIQQKLKHKNKKVRSRAAFTNNRRKGKLTIIDDQEISETNMVTSQGNNRRQQASGTETNREKGKENKMNGEQIHDKSENESRTISMLQYRGLQQQLQQLNQRLALFTKNPQLSMAPTIQLSLDPKRQLPYAATPQYVRNNLISNSSTIHNNIPASEFSNRAGQKQNSVRSSLLGTSGRRKSSSKLSQKRTSLQTIVMEKVVFNKTGGQFQGVLQEVYGNRNKMLFNVAATEAKRRRNSFVH